MTTVKFRPLTVEDRPGTIVYLVTYCRITRQITTSYKVFPREWNEEHSKPIAADNDGRAAIVQWSMIYKKLQLKKYLTTLHSNILSIQPLTVAAAPSSFFLL